MVAPTLSCAANSDCCGTAAAKGSFESSGSAACCCSSSCSSCHCQLLLGSNKNSNELSCSSSSTDSASQNSCERAPAASQDAVSENGCERAPAASQTGCGRAPPDPGLSDCGSPVKASKPHKAHDDAWACMQSLKSRVGNVAISHFKLLCRVGHGDIGHVFLAQLRGTQCHFAMKVMDKEDLKQRKKLQRMHREREILGCIDHPFLPTLYAHFDADQFSCLVMDYCSGGDLHALRQRFPGRRFLMKAVRFYAAEVLVALEYLHMLGIVYRDLKPENVLVRGDGHIMLTDFDLSFKSDVQPTLMKCPLSASYSSSSGRFGLLRSFSMSSSTSFTSFVSRVQENTIECRLPSACSIHPLLACLPLTASICRRDRQHGRRQQKNRLSIHFLKQSMKAKPCMEDTYGQAPVHGEKDANHDGQSVQEQDEITPFSGSQTTPISNAALSPSDQADPSMPDPSEGGVDEALLGLQLIAEPTLARSMSFVGTHEYLSPEMIQGNGHGSAVDWWTFGIFLFELLYGKTPFKGSCNEQTLLNIIREQLRFPERAHIHVGEDAKSLIEGLLEKDPRRRLGSIKGAAEIKQHSFFQGVNWALIRSAQPPEIPKVFWPHSHQQNEARNSFINGRRRAVVKANSHFEWF